jgi:hypothetical protein
MLGTCCLWCWIEERSLRWILCNLGVFLRKISLEKTHIFWKILLQLFYEFGLFFFNEVMRGQFINFFYYNRFMNSFRGISLSKRMVRSVDSHCLNFTGTSVHRNFVEVGNPQDDSKWLRSLSHSKTETICEKAFIIESLSVTLSAVECLLLLQL